MPISDALQVVQIRVSQLDGDRARVEIVADYDDAKKRETAPSYDGLERVYAWNSTMGRDAPVDQWSEMPYTRSRTVGGRTLDRHVITAEMPAKDVANLEVALIAKTNAGEDVAQWPDQNFRPGFRIDPKRDFDGRFARVDDGKLVRDVASLRVHAKEIVERFGDLSVGALRALLGGRSITQIRSMGVAARASVLGPILGVSFGNRAAQGSVLALT